jgi:hypothetical protein
LAGKSITQKTRAKLPLGAIRPALSAIRPTLFSQ